MGAGLAKFHDFHDFNSQDKIRICHDYNIVGSN